MPVSRLDVVYRKFLLTKFFTKGWGSPEKLIRLFKFRRILSDTQKVNKLISKRHKITILNEQTWADCKIVEGKFKSPFSKLVPELVSSEIEDAYFQMILPLKWKSDSHKPVCIHLAGTGDHYYWRRRSFLAKPLLKAGIGGILLENPYYGVRKPKDQLRSSLHFVTDIFVMGGCLMLECLVLLMWLEEKGFGPLGVSGVSMGGHMASLAATNYTKPLVVVPCLSWTTASSVFTEGVMSDAIDWDLLQYQYFSNPGYHQFLSRICKIVDDPLKCQLTRTTEHSINLRDNLLPSNYVTPYEILTMLNGGGANCAAVYYKQSSQVKSLETEFSFSNILMNNTIYQFRSPAMEQKKRDKEAIWFMRGIMDECTHLKNFSVPFDTSLVIAICAKADGYVPREGCSDLEEVWPGSTVRYIDAGHVSAYIRHQNVFRKAIIEAFERAKSKYPPPQPS